MPWTMKNLVFASESDQQYLQIRTLEVIERLRPTFPEPLHFQFITDPETTVAVPKE